MNAPSPEMLAMMDAADAMHVACDTMRSAFAALCAAADAAIDAEFAKRNAALASGFADTPKAPR